MIQKIFTHVIKKDSETPKPSIVIQPLFNGCENELIICILSFTGFPISVASLSGNLKT